jgi:hypothetical protein
MDNKTIIIVSVIIVAIIIVLYKMQSKNKQSNETGEQSENFADNPLMHNIASAVYEPLKSTVPEHNIGNLVISPNRNEGFNPPEAGLRMKAPPVSFENFNVKKIKSARVVPTYFGAYLTKYILIVEYTDGSIDQIDFGNSVEVARLNWSKRFPNKPYPEEITPK